MKISIIGAGRVGSTTAFLLMERKLCDEIALVDILGERVEGEALDLKHCTSATGSIKISGSDSYEITKGSDIVVITAGLPRKPGETRLDLANKNVKIVKDVVKNIREFNDDCLLFVISNPVDLMTYVTFKHSGFGSEKVFGLGTMLDTMRLRSTMAEELQLNPTSLDILMLGEHGDSMFPYFSMAKANGESLTEKYGRERLDEIFQKVRDSAAQVIKKKGATFYAPAMAAAEVIECIVKNREEVLPLSNYLDDNDVYVSTPTHVGIDGTSKVDFTLSGEEKEKLDNSMSILRKYIEDTIN